MQVCLYTGKFGTDVYKVLGRMLVRGTIRIRISADLATEEAFSNVRMIDAETHYEGIYRKGQKDCIRFHRTGHDSWLSEDGMLIIYTTTLKPTIIIGRYEMKMPSDRGVFRLEPDITINT